MLHISVMAANCWKPFINARARIGLHINHKLTHQPQVRRRHRITNFACKNKNFYKDFLQKSERVDEATG